MKLFKNFKKFFEKEESKAIAPPPVAIVEEKKKEEKPDTRVYLKDTKTSAGFQNRTHLRSTLSRSEKKTLSADIMDNWRELYRHKTGWQKTWEKCASCSGEGKWFDGVGKPFKRCTTCHGMGRTRIQGNKNEIPRDL